MKPPAPLRPGELAFTLAVLAFSLFAFREAWKIAGFTGLTTGGVMPMAAAAVMIVSGGVIVLDAARRRGAKASLGEMLAFLLPLRLVAFIGLLAAYALAIPYLGFLAASGAFLFAAIWGLWRRGVLWALGIAAISTVAVHVVFRLLFQVVLPGGSLWP